MEWLVVFALFILKPIWDDCWKLIRDRLLSSRGK